MTARAIVLASALLSLAAPAAARPKLTLPVDGAPTITAYYDRDRQAGAVADVHGPAPARWVPGRAYDQHAGTDYVLAGRSGYPALAAADGVVIAHEDGWDNAMGCGCLGNYVVIDHGEGVVTRYGHLEKHTLSAAVVEHRRVARGEVLGTVGNSGWSTATHLHFQVEVDGATVDPYDRVEVWRDWPPHPGVPHGGDARFACRWDRQNPDTAQPLAVQRGSSREVEIVFVNEGTGDWVRVGPGEEHDEGVVLASVNDRGDVVPSFFEGPDWFEGRRVVTSLGRGVARVPPGRAAIFTFRWRVPDDAPLGRVKVYFMPVHQRLGPQPDDCGRGVNFWLDVRAGACEGPCDPGDEQTEVCGNCGETRRSCTADCQWGEWSGCSGQGSCAPADSEACDNACGAGRRECSDACEWGQCAGREAGACESGEQSPWQACEGEARGLCDPGRRRRRCGGDCQWQGWGACQDVVGPARERFDERDNDCDGDRDELWRGLVRCHPDGDGGVFRFRDARNGQCFDGWQPDLGGRPYFYVAKTLDGERPPDVTRLYNDWHPCRGQLLSLHEQPAQDGAAGWRDAGATWYAVAPDRRDRHPGVVAVYRLYKDVPDCGRRYLFLPETSDEELRRALDPAAGWQREHPGRVAFYAWPTPD